MVALYLANQDSSYREYRAVSAITSPKPPEPMSVNLPIAGSAKSTTVAQTKSHDTNAASLSAKSLDLTGLSKTIDNSASNSPSAASTHTTKAKPNQRQTSIIATSSGRKELNEYKSAPLTAQAVREDSLVLSGADRDNFLRACSHDHDLHLAKGQQPLYLCSLANTQTGPDTTPITSTPAFPEYQTFTLHSRSSATRKIYLDFTGHTTTGTSWNRLWERSSFTTPAYSIDADTSTFNSTEHAAIQEIWRRVSEDYAGFDVDVTTEDPGLSGLVRSSVSDSFYGVRVVIGPDQNATGNGGLAYLSTFDDVYPIAGTQDTPCYVFANSNSSLNFMAEAASHEVGHTVGLMHDGTTTGSEYFSGHSYGAFSWAPIMGIGYYSGVVQWSKGEYADANNTQDDLATIGTFIPFISDDHGNTLATATVAPRTSLTAGGVIQSSTDVDVFKITVGNGEVVITPRVALVSPNLRLQVKVLNSLGVIIDTYSGSGNIGYMAPQPISLMLLAGDYYIQLEGIGISDGIYSGYSNYASTGYYDLSATWPAPLTQTPIARTTGTTPITYNYQTQPTQAVNFNGMSSSDPDGTIARYSWNFNDVYPVGATTALATHRYKAPGVYRPVLTVTDNNGATASTTLTITVTGPVIPDRSSLASLSASFIPVSSTYDAARATVQIQDQYGNPLRNTLVTVRTSGLPRTILTTQRTDVFGRITVTSQNFRRGAKGTVRFELTTIHSTTYPYYAADNDSPTFVTITR